MLRAFFRALAPFGAVHSQLMPTLFVFFDPMHALIRAHMLAYRRINLCCANLINSHQFENDFENENNFNGNNFKFVHRFTVN